MGDFILPDPVTQKLFDTLERLGLYKVHPMFDIMRAAAQFGQPDQMLMSPAALEAFKKYHDGK